MKKIVLSFFVIVLLLLSVFYLFVYPKFIIVSGYAAKNMCSCVFVAGIDEGQVRQEDLNFDIIPMATINVDYSNKSVTASVFGMNAKTAYYRKNTGCALISKMNPENVYTYPNQWPQEQQDLLANWFTVIDTIEYLSPKQSRNLDISVESAFLEDDPQRPLKNTRAVVVLYKGQLVGEQYDEHFDKNSRLPGWSMTKSLTAAMLGAMESDGLINHTDPTGIKQWQSDDRKVITWNHLLHMNSGLRWKEEYDKVSDAVIMLFNSNGIGEYAMQMPLKFAPNSDWQYSSGTTNIIATELESYFKTREEYIRYPYKHIFEPIGMYSMLIETDAAGYFVGSSYGWATARDWAKFGQLFLQNGKWAGKQLVPETWVEYVRKPAPNSANSYGGHFWLNKDGNMPDVPRDTYSLKGFQAQAVHIIPSEDLVVVRLGITYNESDFDFNTWLRSIIDVVND